MTPPVVMMVMVMTILIVMKVLTLAFARAEGTILAPAAVIRFFGWPGMRPKLFEGPRVSDPRGARSLALHGLYCVLVGAVLFFLARAIAASAPAGTGKNVIVMILALPGLSLMIHFGFFDILGGGYRLYGVPVSKLFRAPLLARSLAELWSRRWNIAYSEMIAIVVHRPLRGRIGNGGALFASFLTSGLLHELVISVPVHAGYGLPTLYFLLQGGLLALEKKRGRPFGRAWTLFWVTAPLPILFHPWFLRGVVWPLVGP
jgi:hypothetical protein